MLDGSKVKMAIVNKKQDIRVKGGREDEPGEREI